MIILWGLINRSIAPKMPNTYSACVIIIVLGNDQSTARLDLEIYLLHPVTTQRCYHRIGMPPVIVNTHS